jgi:YgiT-type zinc finger domain-containing protein
MDYKNDFTCDNCNHSQAIKVSETYTYESSNGKEYQIENIPMLKCLNCNTLQIEYEGMELLEHKIELIEAANK